MKPIDAERLRAEIERRRLHFNKEAEKYQVLNNGYSQNCYGARDALRDLENFLDTLSEEPDKGLDVTDFCKPIDPGIAKCVADHWWEMMDEEPDKSLEEEAKRYLREKCSGDDEPTVSEIARHFAEWGAEHLRDTTKMMDKSLEEAARLYAIPHYMKDIDVNHIEEYPYDTGLEAAFIAGAEWQKEQMMDEWLKDRDGCFWNGVNEGTKAMEEQMLKDAVEGTVMDFSSNRPRPQVDVLLDPHKYHTGDKVRIVVLKAEEDLE